MFAIIVSIIIITTTIIVIVVVAAVVAVVVIIIIITVIVIIAIIIMVIISIIIAINPFRQNDQNNTIRTNAQRPDVSHRERPGSAALAGGPYNMWCNPCGATYVMQNTSCN